MKTDAKSIMEMAHGAILERCDYEMARVMDNIMEPNTNPTTKRRHRDAVRCRSCSIR